MNEENQAPDVVAPDAEIVQDSPIEKQFGFAVGVSKAVYMESEKRSKEQKISKAKIATALLNDALFPIEEE